jgi:uncharacterized protein involved in tellurium resistance
MGAAIQLRSDYSAADLRRLARKSRDAKQTRRLLALATIYEGGSRTQAAKTGGVGLQIIRDPRYCLSPRSERRLPRRDQ